MISNRLAVNVDKTQVMCLWTNQKRIQIIRGGEAFDLNLSIKESDIREKP